MYGPADERESIATIHAALERGVTLLDTGDFYGVGHNEMLIGRALRDRRDKALLSVKFGALRGPDGGWLGVDARPAAVKNFLAYSLTRLGVDHIDIYRPGAARSRTCRSRRPIGAIADLVKAGYVRAIGLSEVGPDTIRRAHAVHPIGDLQIEYSLISRGPEAKIFPLLRRARHRRHRLRRALARPAQRLQAGRARATSARTCRASPARTASGTSGSSTTLQTARRREGRQRLAARDRLGARRKARRIVPVIGARTRAQLAESLGALEVDALAGGGRAHRGGGSRRPRSPAPATTSSRCGSSTASAKE